MFAELNPEGASLDSSDMYDLLENCGVSAPSPELVRRTSDILVVGRSHEFVEDERKFRIPVFCSYCDGMLQRECDMGCACDMHVTCMWMLFCFFTCM